MSIRFYISVSSTSSAVKFKCPACGRCYQGVLKLCAHLKEDHWVTPTLQCKVCSASFSQWEELTLHVTQHRRKSTKPYQQEKGENLYDTGDISPPEFCSNPPSPLATSFMEDHEEVLVEPAASPPFSLDAEDTDPLAVDTESHIENECECGVVLSNTKQLEYHKNSHSLRVCVRPKCPKCSADFSGIEEYFNHQCSVLSVTSNTQGDAKHIRTCFECNKNFVIASDILLHERKFGLGNHQLFDFIIHSKRKGDQRTKITPVTPLPANVKFCYPKVTLQKLVSGASAVSSKRRTRKAPRGPVRNSCIGNSGGYNDPVGCIRLVDPSTILEAGGILSDEYTDVFEPDVTSVCSNDSGDDVVLLEESGSPNETSRKEMKRLELSTGWNSSNFIVDNTITGNLSTEPTWQAFGIINEERRKLRTILPKPAPSVSQSKARVGTTNVADLQTYPVMTGNPRLRKILPKDAPSASQSIVGVGSTPVAVLETCPVMTRKPGLRKVLRNTSISQSTGGTTPIDAISVAADGSKKKKRKEPLNPKTDGDDEVLVSVMSISHILKTTEIRAAGNGPKKKKTRKEALKPRAADSSAGPKKKRKRKEALKLRDVDSSEDADLADNNTEKLATEIKRKYVKKRQNRKDKNCDHCGQEFQNLQELFSHMADHKKRQNSYECEFCGVVYMHRCKFARHKMEHPENTQIFCRHCGLPYITEEKLKDHMKMYHRTSDQVRQDRSERRLCDICGKNVKHLVAHRKLHEGKIYKCDECDKAFNSKTLLRFHKNSHLAVPPYKCGFCSWRYADQNQIKFHMIRRHLGPEGFVEVDVNGLEKNFICDQCGRGYTTAFALKEHQMFHEEPTVACPRCPELFHTKYEKYSHYWKSHVGPSHGERKNYNCNLCDKVYKVLSDLKYHQATHTGVFKFRCEVCGKGTHSRGNLNAHMKKHGGGYCCPTCNDRFLTFPLLTEHVKERHGQAIDLYDWRRSSGMGTYAK